VTGVIARPGTSFVYIFIHSFPVITTQFQDNNRLTWRPHLHPQKPSLVMYYAHSIALRGHLGKSLSVKCDSVMKPVDDAGTSRIFLPAVTYEDALSIATSAGHGMIMSPRAVPFHAPILLEKDAHPL